MKISDAKSVRIGTVEAASVYLGAARLWPVAPPKPTLFTLDTPQRGKSGFDVGTATPSSIVLDRVATARSWISWDAPWPVGSRIVFDWSASPGTMQIWASLDDVIGLGTPTHDILKNATGGSGHVDYTIPSGGFTHFGFSVSNGQPLGTLTISNFAVYAPATISDFYGVGPGKIPTHYASDAITGSDASVTAVLNKGGAGSVFNAPVIAGATPLTRNGNWLEATQTSGYPLASNPLDMMGVHFIFVLRSADPTVRYRLFGRTNPGTIITLQSDGAQRQFRMSRQTPSWTNVDSDLFTDTTNATIYEISMSETTISFWRNGVSAGVRPNPFSIFQVDQVSRWNATTDALVGGMGDMVAVVRGSNDEQIATRNAIMPGIAAKYGLTLP